MPNLSLMPSGLKTHVPGFSGLHEPSPRRECKGWTLPAARRNDLFLRSVDPSQLTGAGFALTLTVRDCPETHEVWERMRRAYLERLRRMGLLRLHWLTEWQLRSRTGGGPVPHFHIACYFCPDALFELYLSQRCPTAQTLAHAWCEVAADCGAALQAQHVRTIENDAAWFGYLAKHGARGVFHYQRQRDTMPLGWLKTGRLWGKSGDWPISVENIEIDFDVFYALRRVMSKLQKIDARRALREAKTERQAVQARKRIKYLKSQHRGARVKRKNTDTPQSRARLLRSISEVSGISEWCDTSVFLRWLHGTCVLHDFHDENGEISSIWRIDNIK